MRIIGAADEFWRVRITRVDTTADIDFEWHDDILYREPQVRAADELALWTVEAVRLDDAEEIIAVATFDNRDDAETLLAQARDDLIAMTKTQFEEAYLTLATRPDEEADVT